MGVTLFTRSEERKSRDLATKERVTSVYAGIIISKRANSNCNARKVCPNAQSVEKKCLDNPSHRGRAISIPLDCTTTLESLTMLKELMEEHKVATQSSFGTRTSSKKANVQRSTSPCKENHNPNELFTAKVRLTFIISHKINVYTYITMCALISYAFRQK